MGVGFPFLCRLCCWNTIKLQSTARYITSQSVLQRTKRDQACWGSNPSIIITVTIIIMHKGHHHHNHYDHHHHTLWSSRWWGSIPSRRRRQMSDWDVKLKIWCWEIKTPLFKKSNIIAIPGVSFPWEVEEGRLWVQAHWLLPWMYPVRPNQSFLDSYWPYLVSFCRASSRSSVAQAVSTSLESIRSTSSLLHSSSTWKLFFSAPPKIHKFWSPGPLVFPSRREMRRWRECCRWFSGFRGHWICTTASCGTHTFWRVSLLLRGVGVV